MGIPGLFKELGPGQRISLAEISVRHLEQTGRPFRLAIDYAIWSFQNQAGRGGRSPALRTLYYRCLKLLSLAIKPVFVFDGSRKPLKKRDAVVYTDESHWTIQTTKELLDAFGFTHHQAPGEAEAECALLQARGLVDAVLTEDVDVLLFGCRYSLRDWSAETSRTNKTPTHVSVHTEKLVAQAGFDRQGLILVALMSGGDYNTSGIPGCGLVTACEAARAGFGNSLCDLDDNDSEGIELWRQGLQTELRTNQSKHFRQKHRTLILPETFPDKTIWGYYKHPVTSDEEGLASIATAIQRGSNVDVPLLRAFVATHFGWQSLRGSIRMIRGLAPALLTQKLLSRQDQDEEESIEVQEVLEHRLIKCISGRRLLRDNTDSSECQELRITYIPAEIVGLNLGQEDQDDSVGDQHDDPVGDWLVDPSQSRSETRYDPTDPQRIWVLETLVKLGTPLLSESWEEDLKNLKKLAAQQARQKKAMTKMHPQYGDMDRYVRIRKDVECAGVVLDGAEKTAAAALGDTDAYQVKKDRRPTRKRQGRNNEEPPVTVNPWTLSKRLSDTHGFRPLTRYSALGIYPVSGDPKTSETRPGSPCLQEVEGVQEGEEDGHHARLSNDAEPLLSQDLSNVTMRTPKHPKRSPRKIQSSARGLEHCSGSSGDEAGSCPLPGSRATIDCHNFDTDLGGQQAVPNFSKIENSSIVEDVARLPAIPKQSTEQSTQGIISDTQIRRLVALRRSLEGAWKYLLPEERQLTEVVFENVELLDLTN